MDRSVELTAQQLHAALDHYGTAEQCDKLIRKADKAMVSEMARVEGVMDAEALKETWRELSKSTASDEPIATGEYDPHESDFESGDEDDAVMEADREYSDVESEGGEE